MSDVTPENRSFDDVEFGEELPTIKANISMANIVRFTKAAGMPADRFTDHEAAKKAGLPGAIVPGIMSQGLLVAMINNWAPNARFTKVDTIFRAAVIVDSDVTCKAVITDMDEEARTIELDLTMSNEKGETRVMGTAIVGL